MSKQIKDSSEEEIKRFYEISYDEKQVNQILNENKLDPSDFQHWMYGQTGSLIYKDGKTVFGYYKSDVDTYLRYKKAGYKQVPVSD